MKTTEEDLGNPEIPQPGDPDVLMLRVPAQLLQIIVAGLGELPTKVGGDAREEVRRQVREAVLASRRARAEAAKRAANGDSHERASS
jgi:hypothetical protein